MIQERPRESLVLFDNPIEVTASNNNLIIYRSLPESQLVILSPAHSVVSFSFLITVSRCPKEKKQLACYGKQAQAGRHFECNFASSRMDWRRKTVHLIRVPLASHPCRCRQASWNAWPKAYGTPSSWVRHLPSSWRALLLVLRWDHQISNAPWGWARSSSPPHPWRD